MNWLQQLFPPAPILLVHHRANNNEMNFLKEALESSYNCEVSSHPWSKENSFMDVVFRSVQQATPILFILSQDFLNNLDELPEEGKKLYQLAVPSSPQDNKIRVKFIIVDNYRMKELNEKLTPHVFVCFCENADDKREFINKINDVGLRPLSGKRAKLVSSLNATPQSTTPMIEEQQNALQENLTPLSLSSTEALKDIWAVPKEYGEPSFTPSSVKIRNDVIINRKDVIATIHDRFKERRGGKIYQVLHGLPGVGKSAVALKYAYTYRCSPYKRQSKSSYHVYRVVLWLDMREEQTFDESYQVLSNYDESVPKFLSANELNKWLQEDIEKQLNNEERWLLIIDGCKYSDFERITELYPQQSGKGDVLVTMYAELSSRDADSWLEVQRLSREEGANLLAEVTDKNKEKKRQKAEKIAETLNGLPLAIEIAGFSIKGLGNYEAFLNSYEEGLDVPEDWRPITRTFNTLLKEIEKRETHADELLQCSAFLAQKPIPEKLFKELLAGRTSTHGNDLDTSFNAALRTLKSFSLLKVEEQANVPNEVERLYSIPSIIIRQISYSNEQGRKAYAQTVIEAISVTLPRGRWDRWSSWPFYLPHIRQCIKYIKEFNISTIEAVQLLYTTGCFLRKHPQPQESEGSDEWTARRLLIHALRIRRRLVYMKLQPEDEYPDLLTCWNALAELCHEQFLYSVNKDGEPKKTRKVVQRIYFDLLSKMQNRPERSTPFLPSLEPKNVDEITVLSNLGRLYDDFYEYDEAETKFCSALNKIGPLQRRNRALFIEKSLTRATLLNDLAVTLMKADKFEEAQKKLTEALDEIVKIRQEIDTPGPFNAEEYKKRCGDYEIQCKANRAALSIIQNFSSAKMPRSDLGSDLSKAVTVANGIIEYAKTLGEVPEVDYLRLLRRINNLAEFYYLRTLTGKKANDDEKTAFCWYKKAIEEAFSFWKCSEENSIPHPLILTILDNFDALLEQAKTIKRAEDTDTLIRKASTIREKFHQLNRGGD